MRYRAVVLIAIVCGSLAVGGCAPSYPKATITASVEKMLRKEHKLSGRAHLVGKTLHLDIQLPELAGMKSEIPKEAMKKLEGAIISVTRVSLSSDADIQFMSINAEIPKFNITVHVLQRMADIKGFLYQRISKGDYEERTVLDIFPTQNGPLPPVYEDISLERFVSLLIISQTNMLTRVNPFVGQALNNAKLSLDGVANNTLFVSIPDRLTPQLTELWKEILVEKALKIALKYEHFLPEKVLLRDSSGATTPINLFGHISGLSKPLKSLKNH